MYQSIPDSTKTQNHTQAGQAHTLRAPPFLLLPLFAVAVFRQLCGYQQAKTCRAARIPLDSTYSSHANLLTRTVFGSGNPVMARHRRLT